MTTLNYVNHEIELSRENDNYIIAPKYNADFDGIVKVEMGDIILDKQELSNFIVKLMELLHG